MGEQVQAWEFELCDKFQSEVLIQNRFRGMEILKDYSPGDPDIQHSQKLKYRMFALEHQGIVESF